MRFFVNIDHVATLRQARRTDEPDPVRAAVLAELGGADGLTVHLREDRRHVNDRDVRLLAQTARTPLNLEMARSPDIADLACDLRPHQVTLVPERREEVTTEGGLALRAAADRAALAPLVERLRDHGIRVSLFIDPDEAALDASCELGVEAIELHTGEYANATAEQREAQRARLAAAARAACERGLAVHAGHGLTYENVAPIAAIPEIEELNIGHSIIARAVLVGLERAVREMAELLCRARGTA